MQAALAQAASQHAGQSAASEAAVSEAAVSEAAASEAAARQPATAKAGEERHERRGSGTHAVRVTRDKRGGSAGDAPSLFRGRHPLQKRAAIPELVRARSASEPGSLAQWTTMSSSDSPRYPVTVTQLPVTRCQICRRTVAYRPGQAGAASAALTEHYRRAHPKRSAANPTSDPAPRAGARPLMTGAGKPQILRKSHADDGCFPDRAATEDGDVRIDAVTYDHPDAARLIERSSRSTSSGTAAWTAAPSNRPSSCRRAACSWSPTTGRAGVGCGGWRAHGTDAEIKRMYVTPAARGRGLARRLLAELERTARAAGHRRVILETGSKQPEAVGLYRSSGYTEIPAYGYYACSPHSMHLGKVLRGPEAPGPATPGPAPLRAPARGPGLYDGMMSRKQVGMSVPGRGTLRTAAAEQRGGQPGPAAGRRDRRRQARRREGPHGDRGRRSSRRGGHAVPALSHPGGAAVGTGRAVPGDRPRRRTPSRREPGTRPGFAARVPGRRHRAARRADPAAARGAGDPGSRTVALREAISQAIDRILDRGRAEGTIRPDITSGDIIIMGALLAQPLPYAPNWDQTARRAARIYLVGLAPGRAASA